MSIDLKPTADQSAVDRFEELKSKASPSTPVTKRIAVVSTARCGSSLFCSSLESTGLFGMPHEWLNPRIIESYAKVWRLQNVHIGRYLNHVIERTASPNGVFSVKFHVHQMDRWAQKKFDLMSLKFDHIIYLYRRDKVSQAYSHAKALITDRWQTNLSGNGTTPNPVIGIGSVLNHMSAFVEQELRFTKTYSSSITARFAYEDFAADADVYRQAFEACGIETPPALSFSTPLGILRTAEDEQRVADIKAYLTGQPSHGQKASADMLSN